MLSLFLYRFLFPFRFLFRFGFLFLFLFNVPIPDSGFPLFQTPPKRKFSNYLQRSYPSEYKKDHKCIHYQRGGDELGSLFVRTILAIVTSRRENRATSRSFRKWRRCHFQMLLLKLVFLDIDAPKWFLSW